MYLGVKHTWPTNAVAFEFCNVPSSAKRRIIRIQYIPTYLYIVYLYLTSHCAQCIRVNNFFFRYSNSTYMPDGMLPRSNILITIKKIDKNDFFLQTFSFKLYVKTENTNKKNKIYWPWRIRRQNDIEFDDAAYSKIITRAIIYQKNNECQKSQQTTCARVTYLDRYIYNKDAAPHTRPRDRPPLHGRVISPYTIVDRWGVW